MIQITNDHDIRAMRSAWKKKEKNLELTLASMGDHPERYPDSQRRADDLTDEIVDDLRAIGRAFVRMNIWVQGAEL